METGEEGCDSPESRSLAQQNVDLRRRLDEEQAAYKRKLTAYQEGQQRQAQLVQKLQAKVQHTGSTALTAPVFSRTELTCVCVSAGPPVQEEVCGSRADAAGEIHCENYSRYSPHFLSHCRSSFSLCVLVVTDLKETVFLHQWYKIIPFK